MTFSTKSVSDEYIEKVCRVMLAANWHTYQILTKRADRMTALLRGKLRNSAEASHIWWGVSVENRQHGLPRIAKLRSARRAWRFCRSNLCWKTSAHWIWAASTG